MKKNSAIEAISLENMVAGLNELLLWHGTSREAAKAIATDGCLGGSRGQVDCVNTSTREGHRSELQPTWAYSVFPCQNNVVSSCHPLNRTCCVQ